MYVFWHYGSQVDRTAVRIASSPNARIATGLLLAVLLSVVGYQVVRRLNSQGPEALLKRADGSLRLVLVDLSQPSVPYRKQRVQSRSRLTR